jgi:hypothetical protein
VEGGHPRLEFIGRSGYRFDPQTTAVFRDSTGVERKSEYVRVMDSSSQNSQVSSRLLVMPPPFSGESGANGAAPTTVYLEDSHGRHGPVGTFTYINKLSASQDSHPSAVANQSAVLSSPQEACPDPALFSRLVDFVRNDLLGSSDLTPSKKALLTGLLAAGRGIDMGTDSPSPRCAVP